MPGVLEELKKKTLIFTKFSGVAFCEIISFGKNQERIYPSSRGWYFIF